MSSWPAAGLGDTVNYWIGHFVGPKVFTRDKSRFFKKEHLERPHRFYEKYGAETIIIARFVPIIRTFAPFVAGIGRMSYLKFISYNVIGGISWVVIRSWGVCFRNIPVAGGIWLCHRHHLHLDHPGGRQFFASAGPPPISCKTRLMAAEARSAGPVGWTGVTGWPRSTARTSLRRRRRFGLGIRSIIGLSRGSPLFPPPRGCLSFSPSSVSRLPRLAGEC